MSLENSTSGMFKIPILTGTNWIPFKRRMTGVLRELKLYKYVDGSATLIVPLHPTALTAAEITANEAWEEGNDKAMNRIVLSISDEQSMHVMDAETAKSMWDKLRNIHEPHGLLGILA
ncbi:hypothetical protein SISNIDRAFT_414083, partial [Sistotremastrum niveocremeum HHB9708]